MRYLCACALLLSSLGISSAQNILNNSGFEEGLMCYLTTIWSDVVFYQGDYRLTLSTDAHSGNYSLQIACGGTDCPKAAAVSNNIGTAPNQDFILTVWTKCAAGGSAAVYVPDTAGGDTFRLMTCNGSWAQNTVTFRAGPTATDFFYYLVSYSGTQVRFDDVVLTYGNGTAGSPTPLHPGNRNVSRTEQSLVVDGAPYLALGFFNVGYSDLPQAASMGANTLFGLSLNSGPACFNTSQKSYMDRAYELGLNVVPDSSTTARLAVPAVFPAVMQKFGPHLANIAWMLADEPDQAFVPYWYMDPASFIANANAAKTKTTLPIYAGFQRAGWSVASDLAPYVPAVDLFMGQPFGASFDSSTYAANMFKSFAPARPIWMAQDDIAPNLIVPKAYWLVANGVTGIAYFIWDSFKNDPAKLAAATQAFSELGQLKSVILSPNLDALVASPAGVRAATRYKDGSLYILAASDGAQSAASTLRVPGLVAGQQIQVMFENRTITAAAGSLTDAFAGVSRHVYVVKAPSVGLAGTLVAKSGIDAARVWTINLANTGLMPLKTAAISSAAFRVMGGKSCTPRVVSALPIPVGDLAPGASAPASLVVDFTGCDATTRLGVNFGLTAVGVSNAMVRNNERK